MMIFLGLMPRQRCLADRAVAASKPVHVPMVGSAKARFTRHSAVGMFNESPHKSHVRYKVAEFVCNASAGRITETSWLFSQTQTRPATGDNRKKKVQKSVSNRKVTSVRSQFSVEIMLRLHARLGRSLSRG